MKGIRLLGIILICHLPLSGAIADELTVGDKFRAVLPKDYVIAFSGHCLLNPGRLDKIGAAATALGYRDTPEPFRTMLAPQGADAPYHSWFVIEGQGSPYLLGISEAPFEEKTYQFCAVSNPFLDAEIALKELSAFLTLGEVISDESLAGQRTRIWLAPEIAEGAFLTASDIGAMGSDGVTLSLSAPKQY